MRLRPSTRPRPLTAPRRRRRRRPVRNVHRVGHVGDRRDRADLRRSTRDRGHVRPGTGTRPSTLGYTAAAARRRVVRDHGQRRRRPGRRRHRSARQHGRRRVDRLHGRRRATPAPAPSPRSRRSRASTTRPTSPGTVTTEGVVVGDYEGPSPTLRGFYLQDRPATATPPPPTASSSSRRQRQLGRDRRRRPGDRHRERVPGPDPDLRRLDRRHLRHRRRPSPRPTSPCRSPRRPRSSAYEGMLVRVPADADRDRALPARSLRPGHARRPGAASTTRPTSSRPGAPAIALQAAEQPAQDHPRRRRQAQNPDPIVFGRGGQPLSASNTLRGGDTVNGPDRRPDLHVGRQRGQRQRLPRPPAQRARRRRVDFQPTNAAAGAPPARSAARSGSSA